ncbi:hypothetical protein Ngar_c13640 [Candidatus Nitrososphaera gargensis Ga9.2]|uniref:Uncharacterized protein n=1 Tax=Nitrososphaera gargensis (strain Ga9.2) TaxID=1237085 RepID=K0IJ88_NITGG|nr:hypothetical protein [Candidatus Nitrososphaera gargensis]AFU58302.1 hypothetical protein Ngar_c13640 [Candidatus Nitrososphaera gargensis Ga9.2]
MSLIAEPTIEEQKNERRERSRTSQTKTGDEAITWREVKDRRNARLRAERAYFCPCSRGHYYSGPGSWKKAKEHAEVKGHPILRGYGTKKVKLMPWGQIADEEKGGGHKPAG